MSNNNCEVKGATCENNDIVKSIKVLLSNFKGNPKDNLLAGVAPVSQSTIANIENALDEYMKECSLCAREGRNDSKCMEQASLNLRRRVPIFSNNIYPWKNYDWSYGNYVVNNYSPSKTGATVEGSFNGLRRNAIAINKLVNGYIKDPNPGYDSAAASPKQSGDYPYIDECLQDPGCRTQQKVRAMLDEKKPTDDEFLDKKLDGKYSSSYFFKVGNCAQPKITSKNDCEKKGYTWSPISESDGTGNCFSPRYAFVDNSAKTFFNGSKMEGILPTMASDMTLLSPDNIAATLTGKSIRGSYQIQSCPSVDEEFIDINEYKNKYKNVLIYSPIIIMVIYGLMKVIKKYK